MRMQCAQLKAKLGKRFEWFFIDSPLVPRTMDGSEDILQKEPSAFEKSLSKGKPFAHWYSHGNDSYHEVDEGIAALRNFMEEHAPIDVLVSFSQGSNLTSMLLGLLRKENALPPWRVSVFFCGGQIDDLVFQWPSGCTSTHPTIRVYNVGLDSSMGTGGEFSLAFMYQDLLELSHTDGHQFPQTQPRASEIYQEVAKVILDRLQLGSK